jgi:hypothetical protein
MEIIIRRTHPKEREWVGTCMTCGSKAKAKQSEMNNIRHDQREGENFSWEKCPCCGAGDGRYGGMLFYPLDSI